MSTAAAAAIGIAQVPGTDDYVCPGCAVGLEWVEGSFQCVGCEAIYGWREGIAVLTRRSWKGWEDSLDEDTRVLLACAREGTDLHDTLREFVQRRQTPRAEALARRLGQPRRVAPAMLLDLHPEHRILDLGCGLNGSLGAALAPRLRRVDVLDLRPERLVLLRALAAASRAQLVLAQGGDGRHLPFRAATFDGIIVDGAFARWQSAGGRDQCDAQRRLLSELRRVLKPGGQLYLTVENRLSGAAALAGLKRVLGGRASSVDERVARPGLRTATPVSSHSIWEYRRMLAAAGFARTAAFAAHPDYDDPLYLLPVSRAPRIPRRIWREVSHSTIVPLRRRGWNARIRAFAAAAARRPWGRHFAHSFVVIAGESPTQGLAARMLRVGLGDDAVPLALLVRATDCVVIPAYRCATDKVVYLKVPMSRAGRASVAHHRRVVRWLRSKCPEVLTPEPLAAGTLDGYAYSIEAALRGTPGARLRGNIDTLVARASAALSCLHLRTRSSQTVVTKRLWQRRMRTLGRRRLVPERATWERLCECFIAELERLPVSVTAHNDFHLGNVLFDERSAVSGVLDWDSADCEGLPGVDLVHLVVSSYRRRTGAPLDATIRRWLAGKHRPGMRIFDQYRRTIELAVDLQWCVVMYVGVQLWRLDRQRRYGLHCASSRRPIDMIIDQLVHLGVDVARPRTSKREAER